MKIIILAGGGGMRLFPLSRSSFPKQFLTIEGEKSLLAKTISRFLPSVNETDIVVITNEKYFYHVKNELAEANAVNAHIVLEPVGRNTAPAIALGVKYCLEELHCPADEVILVAPADHIIEKLDLFEKCVHQAECMATEEYLVTFGIVPAKPETGYGYIETGEKTGAGYKVRSFKEKPQLETAKQYVAAGNYYWNSGLFAFTAGFMLGELEKYQQDIAKLMELSYADLVKKFADMPDISIDYAIAEKSDRVVTIPLSCYWNDVGSWDAMYDILPKDDCGNAMQGDCMALDCHNSLIMGRDRLIAGIGVDDLLLVETDDVIVVSKKGESQKVKNVVAELKKRGRKEVREHTTVYRPWGSYTCLGEGKNYRMRKIRINPEASLSMHRHYHRTEHWIVLSGTAHVVIDGIEKWIYENQSAFVPQTVAHKLENPGKIPLEIIEVQNGSYIADDDLIWLENNI